MKVLSNFSSAYLKLLQYLILKKMKNEKKNEILAFKGQLIES